MKKASFETRGRPRNPQHEETAKSLRSPVFRMPPSKGGALTVAASVGSRAAYLAFRQSRAYSDLQREIVANKLSGSLYFRDGKITLVVSR